MECVWAGGGKIGKLMKQRSQNKLLAGNTRGLITTKQKRGGGVMFTAHFAVHLGFFGVYSEKKKSDQSDILVNKI